SSSDNISLYKVFRRSPLWLAPRYRLYLPMARPTNPISPKEDLAQPFGQPVILILISSDSKPFFLIMTSSLSIREGRYLSDSAKARPQVFKATQAMELRRRPVNLGLFRTPYLTNTASIASFCASSTLPIIRF